MEINLTKGERIIAISALVAISAFFAMFMHLSRGSKSSPQFESNTAINYTMARPDQTYSEYTLDGRELDRRFEGLPSEKTKAKLDKNKKELIAKKTEENKKKEETKKKQEALVKAKAQAQAQAQAKNKQQVLAQQAKLQSANDKNKSKTEYAVHPRSNNYPAQNNNVAPQQKDEDQNSAKRNKKTFTEWRSLLFAAPTTENLTLFVAALRKNEITVSEFQIMAQDLIDQSDLKLKGIGLMALRSAPSLASLSQLVHIEPSTLGNYQSYVEQSINSYLQPKNLQYLNQALSTKDKILIVKSLTLLNLNLVKFSQGDLTGLVDPRNRREGEVVSFSMNNYKSLLPVLSQLGSSQDPELSGMAQQLTALIQTSNNVAQN